MGWWLNWGLSQIIEWYVWEGFLTTCFLSIITCIVSCYTHVPSHCPHMPTCLCVYPLYCYSNQTTNKINDLLRFWVVPLFTGRMHKIPAFELAASILTCTEPWPAARCYWVPMLWGVCWLDRATSTCMLSFSYPLLWKVHWIMSSAQMRWRALLFSSWRTSHTAPARYQSFQFSLGVWNLLNITEGGKPYWRLFQISIAFWIT